MLIDVCRARRLNPVPFLLALACAANVGSAATLIGNPQNMLIGATLELSFARYLREAVPPVALGLMATWALIVWQARGGWTTAASQAPDSAENLRTDDEPPFDEPPDDAPPGSSPESSPESPALLASLLPPQPQSESPTINAELARTEPIRNDLFAIVEAPERSVGATRTKLW